MNDNRPAWDGARGLGGALLSAGRDEWPSDEALAKTLAAVGAGAAVVTLVGAAAAGASAGTAVKGSAALLSFGSLVKWLGVGAASGVLVAGVAHELTPKSSTTLESKPVVTMAEPPAGRPEDAKLAPTVAPAAPAASIAEPSKPVDETPSTSSAPNDSAERVPLAAEVALVDRARALLSSGDAARALAELRGYEAEFPEPRLEPEVLFLRMEAHLALGNATRARQTAEQSLRLFPRSPHAARARQVIDGKAEEKK